MDETVINIILGEVRLQFQKDIIWLTMPDGEGMSVTRKELEILLIDYYDSQF